MRYFLITEDDNVIPEDLEERTADFLGVCILFMRLFVKESIVILPFFYHDRLRVKHIKTKDVAFVRGCIHFLHVSFKLWFVHVIEEKAFCITVLEW